MSYAAAGSGWEMNTGGFAIKKSAIELVYSWISVFQQDSSRFAPMETGEQQGKCIVYRDRSV